MNKVLYAVLFFLLLGGSATLYSQQSDNVEITLPGSDAVSGFQVLRADTTLLFRVAGDGSVTIPGMTGTARRAIATPVTGMLVFQNDETIGLYYFDGTEWRTLPLNSVTTGTISNGAVTSDKMALSSVTTNTLANDAVTNAKIAAGTITADKLASGVLSGALTPGSVTTGTLADGAVTSAKIADSTIVNADVSPTAAIAYSKLALTNSIANGDLTANSVTTSKVANGTVTTAKMADSAISGLKLLTYAVTNRHIADGAVTPVKIDPTGASSGNVLQYNGTNVVWGSASPSAGSVGTTELADGAVTTAKILDSTITSADISPSAAIPYSKLSLNNSIQNSDIVANAITTSKVANGTVTTSKMADSAVSGLKLLTYAVTNRHLAFNAVTTDKIDPTGANSGDVLTYNGTNVAWVAGGGTVSRNSTLTGTGASGSPLGINLGNSNTWTANQTFGGTFLIASNSRIAMTNSDNNARDIRFQEPSGTGSQYVGLRAPSVSNNGNYVLPAVVGSVGQVLTLATSNGVDSATTYWSTPSSTVAAGSVGTTELADGAVTSAKILDSTITTADIASNAAIHYSKLALNNSIANSDLTANSVTTSKVANGTVTTSKLADSAVSGLKLLTYAVTNRHLADGAVTGAKISYPLSMTAGNGVTALQVSSGRVALSYGEVTAANGGVAITDGPAIVVIRAGASTGFNITLPTGTHNGQLLTIYNSDGNTATVSSGNVLNAQTTIPTNTSREYIWVTTNSNSGWVGK